jgi:membrane protease YdiL (CAAX protease family)
MKKNIGKGFQALGIASLFVGLVHSIGSNDMWGLLYYFLAGIVLFYTGRMIEKPGVKA